MNFYRSLPCATAADIQALQSYVSRYANHPNQLLIDGKPLVSTFAGEGCSFGGDFVSTWSEFKNGLGGKVCRVPIDHLLLLQLGVYLGLLRALSIHRTS